MIAVRPIQPLSHSREIWLACVLAALALFLAFFQTLELFRAMREALGLVRVTLPEKEEERLSFLLIDDPVPDPDPPVDARREASAIQRAKDRNEEPLPETDTPFSEGKIPVATQQPEGIPEAGAPAVSPPAPPRPAEAPSPPEPIAKTAPSAQPPAVPAATPPPPASEPESETALVRAEPMPDPLPPTAPAPPQPPRPPEKQPEESREPPPEAPRPPAEATTPSRPRPAFRVIGNAPGSPGAAPMAAQTGSAKLTGDKAFDTLVARYPEYMAQVQRKLQQSLNAQRYIRKRSYHAGSIRLAFGIGEDGTITKLEIITARDEMAEEQTLSLSAVRDAAPFPPLSEEMLRDIGIFSDMGISIHFY